MLRKTQTNRSPYLLIPHRAPAGVASSRGASQWRQGRQRYVNRGRLSPISWACVLHSQTWVKEIVNWKEKSSLNLPRKPIVSTVKACYFLLLLWLLSLSDNCAFSPVGIRMPSWLADTSRCVNLYLCTWKYKRWFLALNLRVERGDGVKSNLCEIDILIRITLWKVSRFVSAVW